MFSFAIAAHRNSVPGSWIQQKLQRITTPQGDLWDAWHCLAATSSGANFKAMRDDPGKMPSRPDSSDSEQVQKSWACWFNKARVSCGSKIQTESPCFGSSTLPSTHTILHAINFFSLSTSQAVLPRESTDATVRWKDAKRNGSWNKLFLQSQVVGNSLDKANYSVVAAKCLGQVAKCLAFCSLCNRDHIQSWPLETSGALFYNHIELYYITNLTLFPGWHRLTPCSHLGRLCWQSAKLPVLESQDPELLRCSYNSSHCPRSKERLQNMIFFVSHISPAWPISSCQWPRILLQFRWCIPWCSTQGCPRTSIGKLHSTSLCGLTTLQFPETGHWSSCSSWAKKPQRQRMPADCSKNNVPAHQEQIEQTETVRSIQ